MSTRKLQIPEKITVQKHNSTHGTFTIKPLEKAFGHAIGNGLRRILLSSLEGYGITHIKLPKGVNHIFDSVPGMTEDMNNFILNLKQVVFKSVEKSTLGKEDTAEMRQQKLKIAVKGKRELKAKDLVLGNSYLEVCNPEFVICTLDPKADFELDCIVQKGRGYVLATSTQEHIEDLEAYELIDVSFSPIKNVRYAIEDARVEGKTDYESLEISIETNGAITPQEAIEEAAYYLIKHFKQILLKDVITEELPQKGFQLDTKKLQIQCELNTRLEHLKLKPRAYNGLRSNGQIQFLSDIVRLRKSDLKKFRNFGDVTINEIDALLASKGLRFGMDLSPYHLKSDGPDQEEDMA